MSNKTKIVIAADHGGLELKEALKRHFADNYDWIDFGTNSSAPVNYADFGHSVAKAILNNHAERGIIICGTGIGISIAANRHPGIRAALCTDATMARLARQHNNANVLALGARIIGVATAQDCVKMFMTAEYEGGRHDERVNKIEQND